MNLLALLLVKVASLIASLGSVASIFIILDEPEMPKEMIK